MYVAKELNGKMHVLPAIEIEYTGAPLAGKILHILSKNPAYPKELARVLKENEQKIYYHIRNLEKQKLIRVVKKEERGGALAKFYSLSKPAFVLRFDELKEAKKIPKNEFEPFIEEGKMNAKIVIGSPDPHGPERARSRDAHYAIDLGLFFGTFLVESRPSVHLDTEMKGEDFKDNLIVVGGPVINKITAMINEKMPVRFDKKKNIFSSRTRRTYRSDDTGFVLNMKNPFDNKKKLLLVAGKRYSGTRAAIIALMKNFEVLKGKKSIVVQGIDKDYDGIVDDAEILE
ncbi:MAG: S-layer protein [Candidatus Aenigmarchaeota archaeon]|nr:S-layer protein [Candidatus Aenigmarchaeota archaeon]